MISFLIIVLSILSSAGQNLSSYNVTQGVPCKCFFEINGTLQEQPCTEWEYDDSVFESTLVTQVTADSSAVFSLSMNKCFSFTIRGAMRLHLLSLPFWVTFN